MPDTEKTVSAVSALLDQMRSDLSEDRRRVTVEIKDINEKITRNLEVTQSGMNELGLKLERTATTLHDHIEDDRKNHEMMYARMDSDKASFNSGIDGVKAAQKEDRGRMFWLIAKILTALGVGTGSGWWISGGGQGPG